MAKERNVRRNHSRVQPQCIGSVRGARLVDGIVPIASTEDVGVASSQASQIVSPCSAVERVGALHLEGRCKFFPVKLIVPGATKEYVDSGVAVEDVVAGTAVDLVVPGIAA